MYEGRQGWSGTNQRLYKTIVHSYLRVEAHRQKDELEQKPR